MDMRGMMLLQSVIGVFSSAMVIGALFMLWSKHRSNWLLLSLAGEVASLVFRGLFSLLQTVVSGNAAFSLLWQAAGLAVGAGLLGFALEQIERKSG